MDEIIKYLFDFRIVLGAIAGAIIMFFVARKNPKWIEDTYQQQKEVLSTTELSEKLKAAEKQIADMELDSKIMAKATEIYEKMKGLGK